MRLQKYLAHSGVASRRASEQIIWDGRVRVDGEVVTDPAFDIDTEGPNPPQVMVDENVVAPERAPIVMVLNKPPGVVSTVWDTHNRPTVVELVPQDGRRLYPVGRLDADTTGLILLTDDGELANLLTHPSHEVQKTYRARVRGGRVGDKAMRQLSQGVRLDDGMTLPAHVEQPEEGELLITLKEGRKRQVRRMCRAVGHPIISLKRLSLGTLELGDLREGRYRQLDEAEVRALRATARR